MPEEWRCIAIFTPELKQKETRAEIIAENSFEELEGPFILLGLR
jgi:hypothetical protein